MAKEALAKNKTLREVVLEHGLMDAATLDRALEPLSMTRPGGRPVGSAAADDRGWRNKAAIATRGHSCR